jgi:peroxiredoxin Q/BCP
VDYAILSDPTRKVAEAYGVASPGIARWTFYIGLDGKILYIDKQVSPTNQGRVIAAKLAELGVPRRARR